MYARSDQECFHVRTSTSASATLCVRTRTLLWTHAWVYACIHVSTVAGAHALVVAKDEFDRRPRELEGVIPDYDNVHWERQRELEGVLNPIPANEQNVRNSMAPVPPQSRLAQSFLLKVFFWPQVLVFFQTTNHSQKNVVGSVKSWGGS